MIYQTLLIFLKGGTVAKKTISISLWPILILAWFAWGIFDDDEKTELKKEAIQIVVETKETLFEMKDGTVKKLEDMTDSEIEEVTGEEVTQDVYEPPEEKADLEPPPNEYNDEPPDEPKEEEGRTL